jgi:hypothetical protein
MDENAKRKQVLSPVAGKAGKTYWVRMGIGYVNKDNSINLYLDGLPTNGKLQIRDWEEPPRKERQQQQFHLTALPGNEPQPSDDLPF